jgi:hypothetical protein
LIFHNLTLPNASGHFELSFEISLLNHAWIRARRCASHIHPDDWSDAESERGLG